MREFNTTGPCDPSLHYTVMREGLMEVGRAKVEKGQFFTIFAPRQSGKTTYFRLLSERLRDDGYIPIWISFENLKTASRAEFYDDFNHQLRRELRDDGIEPAQLITNQITLQRFFETLQCSPIVLIIDEFEGVPEAVLSEVMHTFRKIYHQKKHHRLHSLILVGVSTIAELVVGPASPFNIANQLEISYFSEGEVRGLIAQYVAESGQPFGEGVIREIYKNTKGQPGLVCALCQYLVTQAVPERSEPIGMAHFYPTLRYFMTQRMTNNITNIVQKAFQRRAFMLKLLFQPEPIPYLAYEPDISWLHGNGVIDAVEGYVDIIVPLYKKVLITAFRPVINGESRHYLTTVHDVLEEYVTVEGGLNVPALLEAYRGYVHRRGFRAFDTEKLREGAWHYSLDGYLNFFIERLGGQTYIEVPSGRGRTDILIRYREQSYIIETKVFTDKSYFKRGKSQLAEYLKSEGLAVGYYVVFSDVHGPDDALYTEDMISGKRIYTYIIRTNFERPSKVSLPDEEPAG